MAKDSIPLTIATILGVIVSILAFSLVLVYLQMMRYPVRAEANLELPCLLGNQSERGGTAPAGGAAPARKAEQNNEGLKVVLQLPYAVEKLFPPSKKPPVCAQIPLKPELKDEGIKIALKLPLPVEKLLTPSPVEKLFPSSKESPSYVKAKIALILDDAGYSLNGPAKILLNIPAPLTFSVIPGIKCSREIAEQAHTKNMEVMLHMPMEYCQNSHQTQEDILCEANRKNDSPYKWALLSGMSEQEVNKQLEGAISGIPHLKGINNHMGSKATSDMGIMSWCMNNLKGKGLYFIDSVTTGKSVAYKLAKSQGIQSGKRDIFLDNEDNVEHVRQQMNRLVKIARAKGYAIGIGHATRYSTALVLKEMIPRLKEEGIEVVPASELIN